VLSVDGGLTIVAPPFWADTTGDLHAAVYGEQSEPGDQQDG
jgi:hypothetical protein